MKVELNLMETTYLCDMIMARILIAGGTKCVPFWVVELYSKLASANCAMKKRRRTKVELNLMETGYLCNLIMGRLVAADKTEKVPAWITELYIKLADANDKLMSKGK